MNKVLLSVLVAVASGGVGFYLGTKYAEKTTDDVGEEITDIPVSDGAPTYESTDVIPDEETTVIIPPTVIGKIVDGVITPLDDSDTSQLKEGVASNGFRIIRTSVTPKPTEEGDA